MNNLILLRGGGDLASGIALRLHHAGYPILITELPQPLAVRRAVAFCEAVYENEWTVENIRARLTTNRAQIETLLAQREIAVLIDPSLEQFTTFGWQPAAIIDARLIKTPAPNLPPACPFTIGLGPGFSAGHNCHAFVETQRGHTLGRAYWNGTASQDTGQPDGDSRRVLRAPSRGTLIGYANIGDHITAGQLVAAISEPDGSLHDIPAPFPGVLRGLIRPGIQVTAGLKIGDIDERNQREYCFLASDKALAIGGGVLEALLTQQTAAHQAEPAK
jgi:xanthine dehydrogenase accessory factor